MQFGGLKALNAVDLAVGAARIHGLIGPNGSGKSTMMNVLTGVYTPTAGEILLGGRPIGGSARREIACRGVARTFQNVQLFGEMTLLENVLVGLHHSYRSSVLDVALRLAARRARGAGARAARPTSSASSGSARWPTRRRATCPTASSACWRSAARWRSTRSCCCSTSRPPA